MRLPDWRQRLVAYLAEAHRLPYVEGEHDCALFTASAVHAMTGVDYAAPYRGRYTTTRGGIRILRKDGFKDHIALAAHHLKEKPVSFAVPGDVAVADADDGQALGIVQGENVYVLGLNGLWNLSLLSAVKCFEV